MICYKLLVLPLALRADFRSAGAEAAAASGALRRQGSAASSILLARRERNVPLKIMLALGGK